MDSENVVKKFQSTPLGKKLQKADTRKNLTDFDRFKVMVLKKRVRLWCLLLINFYCKIYREIIY